MKWTKLKAEHFGPLRRWEGELREPFVVFYGKNEAGKSTMMELMCTLLFGTHKKKSETKKLISWGHSSAQIEGTLQKNDGSTLSVQRTLRTTGMKGTVENKGTLSDLGDRPLSWLSPVDRDLYRNIYALSLYDLLFPGQAAWALTQDQLLSGSSGNHRPASQVREELYRSAMSLWRPDRRGKTRMEELDTQLRELYDRLYQSRENQRQIGELEKSSQACQQQIADLRQRQQILQEALESAMALREKSVLLEEGQKLLEQSGDIDTFSALSNDTEEKLTLLRQQQRDLARQVAESARTLAQLSEQMERFTFREEKILENEGEIQRLSQLQSQLMDASLQLPVLSLQCQEVSQLAAQYLDTHIRDIFQVRDMDTFSPEDLKIASEEAAKAHVHLLQAKDQLDLARQRFRSPWPWVVGSAGFVLLLTSVVVFPPLSLVSLSPLLGWITFGLTAALGITGVSAAAPLAHILKKKNTRELYDQLQQITEQEKKALDTFFEKVQPLTPRQELMEDSNELILRCQKYVELALREKTLTDRIHALQSGMLQDSSQIQVLAQELLTDPTEDALTNLQLLCDALANARRWQQESDDVHQRMSEERVHLSHLKQQQQQAVDAEQEIMNLLYQLPGETISQKLDEIHLRRQAAARGAALIQTPDAKNIPSLADIDADIEKKQADMDTILNQLQQLYNTQGMVSQKLEQFRQQPSEQTLEAEIENVSDQQLNLTRQRDEEALLFALVKVAEQRFREQHQPDVVRRACAYLTQITGGRYSRIVMSEDYQGIRIYSPEAGEFIDPTHHRLSQGTSEQVFLSLRLGLVDHLDPEGENLPLLLDETFVNWDHDRLVRGLSVLAQIAQKRQLILFTCHPWMMKMLDEAGCSYQLMNMEEQ